MPTSGANREIHAPFLELERLGVRFPRPTHDFKAFVPELQATGPKMAGVTAELAVSEGGAGGTRQARVCTSVLLGWLCLFWRLRQKDKQ
jgi:hypothetical protein